MAEIVGIKWLRVNAGLTQQQAAAAIGVTRETFNRWETGKIEIPALKLARFQKVLASNTAFAPPIPDTAPAGPSKAFLKAEYDRWQKRYDAQFGADGVELSDDDAETYYNARDAWYLAAHGVKWLVVLYEDEAARDVARYNAPRERVVPTPANWLKGDFDQYTETPAHKAFVKVYGLDLL